MRNTVRFRLTAIFIGLAIVPLLIMGGIFAWLGFIEQQEQSLIQQQQLAHHVAAQVENVIRVHEDELRLLVEVKGLPQQSLEQKRQILLSLLEYDNSYDELRLFDAKGQEQLRLSRVQITAPDELRQQANADEFLIPTATGEIYYGAIWVNEATGEPLITIAVPMPDLRTGHVDGVLVADMRLQTMWQLLPDVQVSNDTVYVMDEQGHVVADSSSSLVLQEVYLPLPEADGVQIGLTGTNVMRATDRFQLGGQTLMVVAEQSLERASHLAWEAMAITAVIVTITLFMTIWHIIVAIRQVVRPIESLASVAQAIKAGDYSQQSHVDGFDEMTHLSHAFNSMTTQLTQSVNQLQQTIQKLTLSEQSLKKEKEKYHQLVDLAQEGIWLIDTKANTTFVNPRMAKMLGYAVDEMMGKPLFSFMDEQGREIANNNIARRQQGIKEQHDFEFLRKDGTRIYTTIETSPINDEAGNYVGAIAGIIDITERKQAEDALWQYAQRLETLQAVTGALSTSLALEEVLALIFEQLASVITFDSTAIFLLEGNQVRIVACRGDLQTEEMIGQVFPLENTFFQDIQAMAEPLCLIDAQANPRFQKWGESNDIRGWMGVPLLVGGELIGFLTLDSHQPGVYGPDEATLVFPFANQSAQAIDNARLHEQVQRHAEELEERIRDRTEKLNTLVNAMAGREVRMAELKKVIIKLRAQLRMAGMEPIADDPLLAK